MLRLFFPGIVVILFACLTACSSIVVPQIGAVAPCQIQSVTQVENAVRIALEEQHWKVLASADHIIQAEKALKKMTVIIDVAYGYRGFSIEYVRSQNMDYDPDNDTINPIYKKWVSHLTLSVKKNLEQQAKLYPTVQCLGKNALQ